MRVKVLDASALAALLFGEPTAQDIADRLVNARLVAPGLLFFEVASVCLKKNPTEPRLPSTAARRFYTRRTDGHHTG